MAQRFRVDITVYFWLALGLLTMPLSWLLGAALAAGFHELCHFAAAKMGKVPWNGLSVGTDGMVMHMGAMNERDTILVSAAGPAGSLLLGLFLHIWPQVAVCGIVQGLYNLLPVYPLDGGRILYSLMGDRGKRVEGFAVLVILLVGITLGIYTELGISAVLISLLAIVRAIRRKFPCKEAVIGVQ